MDCMIKLIGENRICPKLEKRWDNQYRCNQTLEIINYPTRFGCKFHTLKNTIKGE